MSKTDAFTITPVYTSYNLKIVDKDLAIDVACLYWPRKRMLDDLDKVSNVRKIYTHRISSGILVVEVYVHSSIDHDTVFKELIEVLEKHRTTKRENISCYELSKRN
jgi:hypothetical protein